jgi:magnesium chelatase family protein
MILYIAYMSYARILSAQPYMLEGKIVTVEVDLSRGLHAFSIVGLPDKAVEEAKDRMSSAIKNSGRDSPKAKNHKIVISLSPADIKKEGAYFDLAMALGYLLAAEVIEFDPSKKLFLGELNLSGDILPIKGTLALAEAARNGGITELFVPLQNAAEAALIEGLTVYGIQTLKEVIDHITSTKKKLRLIPPTPKTEISVIRKQFGTDIQEIRGQEGAKRGLEIAAAGGHNIAMSGPPGTGKTMLARAFISLLPELTLSEMLEVTRIHSIAGNLESTIVTHPPLRAPHHTASYVSIIGGGTIPRPGEVTLAHKGVLFLDEFPEFEKRVLESLRQPLEDNLVSISRARGSALFPSNFILVAAMNPCPCGYRGSRMRKCTCMPSDLARYNRKLSGPILDRIDLWVTVAPVEYEKLLGQESDGESSSTVRTRIDKARTRAARRFEKHPSEIKVNSDMRAKDIAKYVILSEKVKKILHDSAKKLQLSGRAYHRVIKLAQTIADLADSETIEVSHVLEALQYRPKI